MTSEQPKNGPVLPPPPERPDCCAGSCAICVLDGYAEALQQWHAECDRIEAAYLAQHPADPSA